MTEVTEKARHMMKICPANVENPLEHCVEVKALFDTGASGSYVSPETAKKLLNAGADIIHIKAQDIGLASKDQSGTIRDGIFVKFIINDCEVTGNAPAGIRIFDQSRDEAVIGLHDMQMYGIEIDIKNGKIRVPECGPDFGIGSSHMPKKRTFDL